MQIPTGSTATPNEEDPGSRDSVTTEQAAGPGRGHVREVRDYVDTDCLPANRVSLKTEGGPAGRLGDSPILRRVRRGWRTVAAATGPSTPSDESGCGSGSRRTTPSGSNVKVDYLLRARSSAIADLARRCNPRAQCSDRDSERNRGALEAVVAAVHYAVSIGAETYTDAPTVREAFEAVEFSDRHMKNVLTTLEEAGLIRRVARGYRCSGSSKPSVYEPRADLREMAAEATEVVGVWPQRPLELRAPKKGHKTVTGTEGEVDSIRDHELVDIKPSSYSRKAADQMRRYWSILDRAELVLNAPGELANERERFLVNRRKYPTRIYNDRRTDPRGRAGGLHCGGRLYRQTWTHLPKSVRRYLEIDESVTVDVDYAAMHPTMVYHAEGLEPPEDPYGFIEPARRHLAKVALNALFNARSERSARGAIARAIAGEAPQAMHYAGAADIIRAAGAYHAPIAHVFGSDLGVRLMRRDSDIIMAAVDVATSRGITPLTVHDATLVPINRAEEMQAILSTAYEREFGRVPRITIETHDR